jgi:hypothetical protein
MLPIKTKQIEAFEINQVDVFISNQIINLREKQSENLIGKADEDLRPLLNRLVQWCKHYNLISEIDIEYLFIVFFKYNLTEEYLRTNDVIEIFTYPNRSSSDKLRNLHFQLEFKKERV